MCIIDCGLQAAVEVKGYFHGRIKCAWNLLYLKWKIYLVQRYFLIIRKWVGKISYKNFTANWSVDGIVVANMYGHTSKQQLFLAF